MNKCLYMKVRTKKGQRYFYCSLKKCEVDYGACFTCLDKEYKKFKRIKQYSKHKETTSKETYEEVFKRDKGQCALCYTRFNLHLHHINGRGKGKTNNPKNCIMLCQNCHLNIVHQNNKKWRPILNEMIKEKE